MGKQFSKRSKEKKDSSQWITIDFPSIISLKSHLKILDRMKLGSELFHRSRNSESYKNLFLLENIRYFAENVARDWKCISSVKKRDKPDVIYTYYRCTLIIWLEKSLHRVSSPSSVWHASWCQSTWQFRFRANMEFSWQYDHSCPQGTDRISLQKILDRARSCRTTPFSGHALIQPEQWQIRKYRDGNFTKCDEMIWNILIVWFEKNIRHRQSLWKGFSI